MLCLGLSFKTAPIALRERAILDAARAAGLLDARSNGGRARGLVALSTCGRTELYADATRDAEPLLVELLAESAGLPIERLRPHLYLHVDANAARHLCRVAAGLDSALPGEPEILGQVADAYSRAREAGSASPRLARLFDAAVRCGRRARRETGINRQATGLGAVPVRVAAEHFGTLADRHVIVLGGGRMGRAALHALAKLPVGRVTVASRRIETALSVARHHGVQASCLGGFRELLADADVVITATAAPAALVDRPLVEGSIAQRPERHLLLCDLGLPRNIAEDVALVPGVTLHDLDALKARVDSVIETRRAEVPEVERIVDEELARLGTRDRQAAVRPILRALHSAAEQLRAEVVAESLAHHAYTEETRRHLESVTRRLVERMLRAPTASLLAAADDGHAEPLASATRALFRLEGTP